jgi:hypothetical protein
MVERDLHKTSSDRFVPHQRHGVTNPNKSTVVPYNSTVLCARRARCTVSWTLTKIDAALKTFDEESWLLNFLPPRSVVRADDGYYKALKSTLGRRIPLLLEEK